MMYIVSTTINKCSTSWGPFHNKRTAHKWTRILEVQNPMFKNKIRALGVSNFDANQLALLAKTNKRF